MLLCLSGEVFVYQATSRSWQRSLFTVLYWFWLYFDGITVVYRLIELVGRVFASGLEDLGSIPGRVIPKTLKIVLDTSLLNTQQYKVSIKGKVEQSGGKE